MAFLLTLRSVLVYTINCMVNLILVTLLKGRFLLDLYHA